MTYAFGGFTLDTDTRALLFDRAEIHLSPKAFELLTTLLVNRPRALSKAELQDKLWPSTFVEETNVAGLVAEIRRALRDEATHPAFVRTVHRFGYRFVGDVTEGVPAGQTGSPPTRLSLVLGHRQVRLLEGANLLGREQDATIQCDAPGVSRHHARILVSGSEASIEDLESKNGTYLNGLRVPSARLSDGDEIRIGTARLIFRIAPAAGSTETLSASATERFIRER